MSGKFEPKVPVQLDPPKSDPISLEALAAANGTLNVLMEQRLTLQSKYVDNATPGKVYDVTGNKAYQPGGSYHVFVGKDASRALGKTSTKPEDVVPDWQDLSDKEKGTLEDWVTFFSKRYNVVGVVQGAKNF
ncbi:hypothetical protein THARTR1_06269 [Trichoderma harzianum]|uniref:Cytochrome b5 heme-binding domain-containing protein n=1 Tax=Trichoderma harzianum TaxID=5544 RepID=A0A2K0U5K2_TRIHA|nr:hypothetical protein THARTR1_06269 [Trichoderma harzianum]